MWQNYNSLAHFWCHICRIDPFVAEPGGRKWPLGTAVGSKQPLKWPKTATGPHSHPGFPAVGLPRVDTMPCHLLCEWAENWGSANGFNRCLMRLESRFSAVTHGVAKVYPSPRGRTLLAAQRHSVGRNVGVARIEPPGIISVSPEPLVPGCEGRGTPIAPALPRSRKQCNCIHEH